MIKAESNLVVELWDQVRDSLPNARRQEIAVGMLKCFNDYGFEKDDLHDIIDEDDILAAAFNEFFDEGEEDEYEDEDENDAAW